MASQTAIVLREIATRIVQRLQSAGFPAFWVGGCVRDFLRGREPKDYDVVTGALPEEVERVFEQTIPVGRKFGVIVVVEEGRQFQVATFRAESDYQDGRHPEFITFGDAMADARRRDFTLNGLFYDPIKMELRDWVGGEADLRAKLIRTIGNPEERFGEDHLRMLRAVRLAAQLDFQIESQTLAAVRAGAERIRTISPERIREELIKLFTSPFAGKGLELLRESGLLEYVLPEIAATVTCEQSPDFHPEGSVFRHLVLMLNQMRQESDPNLSWAVLFHDVAKPVTASQDPQTGSIHFYGHERVGAEMAQQIMERLRFPNRQTGAVVEAVRYHMQFKDALKMRKSTLRELLMRPTFPLELELHRLDCLGSHRRLEIYDFLVEQSRLLEQTPEIRPPLLNGDELIKMGVTPGPELGDLLRELRERQLEDELKTADDARAWVRQKLGSLPGQ